MNARKADRRSPCTIIDARQFLARAQGHLEAIELIENEWSDSAANLAVSAAVHASDAICCAQLGQHSQGQDHRAAVDLLSSVAPDGRQLARDLERVMKKKYDAQYRQSPLSNADAKRIVGWSRRLVVAANEIVRSA